ADAQVAQCDCFESRKLDLDCVPTCGQSRHAGHTCFRGCRRGRGCGGWCGTFTTHGDRRGGQHRACLIHHRDKQSTRGHLCLCLRRRRHPHQHHCRRETHYACLASTHRHQRPRYLVISNLCWSIFGLMRNCSNDTSSVGLPSIDRCRVCGNLRPFTVLKLE